jgi:hypothetical protein
MSFFTRNCFRRGFAPLAVIVCILCLHILPADAYPVVGQEIYYHGGAVQIEILPKDAAYTSQIFLHTDSGALFIGSSTNTGSIVTLSNLPALGLNPGEELIFGIHVVDTGYDFEMGSGYENPDGIAHASVDYVYTHVAVIGFEDLFGGGDFDYNDVKIRVAGDIGISQVPEPSALLLIGSGIPTLILVSRRKRAENS